MKKVTQDWLDETTAEFDKAGTDSDERAEMAEKKFRKQFVAELKETDDFTEQWEHLNKEIEKIESYYLTRSNRDRGWIGAQFTGAYYYRGGFWQVDVPLVMGSRRPHPFKYLHIHPEPAQALQDDKDAITDYFSHYADCYDYCYAMMEVGRRCPNDLSKELFQSADKHIRSATALLLQNDTSSKAIEDAALATEIFLKAFVAATEGLTDKELKNNFGHRLDWLTDHCIAKGLADLTAFRERVLQLPNVQARYTAKERTFGELWGAYRLAMRVGLVVLRHLTNRDCRAAYGVVP